MELDHIANKYVVSENKAELAKLPSADQCLIERHIVDLLKADNQQQAMIARAAPNMQDEIIAGFVNGNLHNILKPENLQKVLEEEKQKGRFDQRGCFPVEHTAQADLPRRLPDGTLLGYGV